MQFTWLVLRMGSTSTPAGGAKSSTVTPGQSVQQQQSSPCCWRGLWSAWSGVTLSRLYAIAMSRGCKNYMMTQCSGAGFLIIFPFTYHLLLWTCFLRFIKFLRPNSRLSLRLPCVMLGNLSMLLSPLSRLEYWSEADGPDPTDRHGEDERYPMLSQACGPSEGTPHESTYLINM
jgi:hypothetical protein